MYRHLASTAAQRNQLLSSDAQTDCIPDPFGQPLNGTSPCLSHLITAANQHYWAEQQYVSKLNHLHNPLTVSPCVSLQGRITVDEMQGGFVIEMFAHMCVCLMRTRDYVYIHGYVCRALKCRLSVGGQRAFRKEIMHWNCICIFLTIQSAEKYTEKQQQCARLAVTLSCTRVLSWVGSHGHERQSQNHWCWKRSLRSSGDPVQGRLLVLDLLIIITWHKPLTFHFWNSATCSGNWLVRRGALGNRLSLVRRAVPAQCWQPMAQGGGEVFLPAFPSLALSFPEKSLKFAFPPSIQIKFQTSNFKFRLKKWWFSIPIPHSFSALSPAFSLLHPSWYSAAGDKPLCALCSGAAFINTAFAFWESPAAGTPVSSGSFQGVPSPATLKLNGVAGIIGVWPCM